MRHIVYRKLGKEDYQAIENLIENSFGLGHYFSNKKLLAHIKHAYLQSCLAEQTYCRIAEQGGVVVGVIMGSVKKQYRFAKHIAPLFLTLWHTMCMNVVAKCSGCDIKDYKRLHQIYQALISDCDEKYDGVLTLFAVDETCRGLGIGTALLNGLQDYYHSCGVKRIYLYTDSSCNTPFYDNHGFSCAKEQDMPIKRDGKETILKIFLYDKKYFGK